MYAAIASLAQKGSGNILFIVLTGEKKTETINCLKRNGEEKKSDQRPNDQIDRILLQSILSILDLKCTYLYMRRSFRGCVKLNEFVSV